VIVMEAVAMIRVMGYLQILVQMRMMNSFIRLSTGCKFSRFKSTDAICGSQIGPMHRFNALKLHNVCCM